MNMSHGALLLATLTATALASAGCRAPGSGALDDQVLAAGERDPRLDNLGLVYDDTIVTVSARTVDFNGQALVPRYVRTEKSGGGADLTVDAAIAKVVFGIHKDMTISLAVPFLSKRLDRPGASPTLRSDGLGDSSLIGKYRFYQDTGPGETTEAAALFGFELPTGRDDVQDGGLRLPQPLQPGSGSLDAILGGAFTRIQGRWLLNADLIAKLNTEANDYRFGNRLRFDVGGHFRAYPARYERFDQTTVNLVAELNGVWSDRDQLNGDPVNDSGGTKLFVTPGLQVIVNQNLLFEMALQLPVLTDLHGSQLEEDFVAFLGLRLRF